jgi:sigma-B regulation protein RsbU (phosphoserine phosphatase)
MPEQTQKVLVVDDERFNINVLVDLLKPSYKMMAAKNGPQALKAAHSANPPDLILLDIMMPEMDGYEVCRRLKADTATHDIPVIFVTAMGDTSDETKGLEVGAVDYLTKPISPPIVLARVKTHLQRKRQRDELQKAYRIIEAQKARMQEELNVGRDIQMSMVPQTFPPFPDRNEFSIHAALHPAREVGGDFYDFFFIDENENRICVCVGDVSGKGVPAALFMAVTRTLIKARATDDISTASIITRVNDELSRDNKKYMFVTVFTAILDVITGQMTYTNAGHNPPCLQKPTGKTILLDARHGPVLGASPGLAYKEDTVQLERDDLLFLYTDGVTEARNPERAFFGDQQLLESLASADHGDVTAVVQHIVDTVKSFENGADQFDDITALALKYNIEPTVDGISKVAMRIRNELSEIETVKTRFNEFSEEAGLSQSIRRKLNLVFDELLNNIISYAFDDAKSHDITLDFELAGNRLSVSIMDDGMPFNPFEADSPDTTLGLDDRQIGGLGIHLVRSLMDKAIYKRHVNRNVVTLVKTVPADDVENQ